MAAIKHISSKNADYGAAEQCLTFEHDEFTMKPVLDENSRMVPRKDYRIATVNCGDEDFAVACLRANMRYKKNSQRKDIKSHHYIISFDPRDAAKHGLTVDWAQELGMEYCEKHFPGHQALVCTHPDGHNHSGNIHVHIVINSLRIQEVERKAYMDRPCDTQPGAKHRCTASAMRYFRSEVMEMCQREGLYQIDLLNGSKEKITEREYWAKKRGQAEKDILDQEMIADGLTPKKSKFETQKDQLRQFVRTALSEALSFEDFSARLMQDYGIEVRESRGRYSYLTPDRTKPITARKLGTDYDKAAVLSVIADNAVKGIVRGDYGQKREEHKEEHKERKRQFKTPNTAIKQEPSIKQDGIQRMVDIQAKMSEGKGKGYEWWAKGFNLQQMSKTMAYLEEYGFSCPEDVDAAIEESSSRQRELSKELKAIDKKISDNKELMRQASVYRRSKPAYDGLKKARNKERYREKNQADLRLFETAGRYFKERGMTKFPDMAKIQEENESLLSRKSAVYSKCREQQTKTADLRRVKFNISEMLKQEYMPGDGRNNRKEKQEENMQFTKSELEMIYKYAATTKEETIRAMKDTLTATNDKLTYITIRNAAEKLEKLPEPECSCFIADNKAHHIEKSVRPSVLRRLAKAKEHVKQPVLQGHDMAGMERFQSDTRHMIVMDVLNNDSPVGFKGERYRFFLSDERYRNAKASEKRGEIKIRSHAAVSEGKIYPDKKTEHDR